MQIRVQDCGCISLPDELAKSLASGPGSVFEATDEGEGRLVMQRVSPPLTESSVLHKAVCTIQ